MPIDVKHIPAVLKQILKGRNMAYLLMGQHDNDRQQSVRFRLTTAMSLLEKSTHIPTSMGVPLRVLSVVPILANVNGIARIRADSNQHLKFTFNGQPMIAASHLQKMEAWMCGSFGELRFGGVQNFGF